jgi:hypothetical protein
MTPKTMVIGTNVKNGNSSTEVKLLSASDTAAGQMRSMRQPLGCGVLGCMSSVRSPDCGGSSELPAGSRQPVTWGIEDAGCRSLCGHDVPMCDDSAHV